MMSRRCQRFHSPTMSAKSSHVYRARRRSRAKVSRPLYRMLRQIGGGDYVVSADECFAAISSRRMPPCHIMMPRPARHYFCTDACRHTHSPQDDYKNGEAAAGNDIERTVISSFTAQLHTSAISLLPQRAAPSRDWARTAARRFHIDTGSIPRAESPALCATCAHARRFLRRFRRRKNTGGVSARFGINDFRNSSLIGNSPDRC